MFKIVETVDNENILFDIEQKHINTFLIKEKSTINDKLCYNICSFVSKPPKVIFTEEMKKQKSEKMSGNKNHFYGRKHFKNSKEKIKLNHANFKGENGTFYGKNHSEESKQKLRKTKIGKYVGIKNPATKIYNLNLKNIKTGEIITGPIVCAVEFAKKI